MVFFTITPSDNCFIGTKGKGRVVAIRSLFIVKRKDLRIINYNEVLNIFFLSVSKVCASLICFIPRLHLKDARIF